MREKNFVIVIFVVLGVTIIKFCNKTLILILKVTELLNIFQLFEFVADTKNGIYLYSLKKVLFILVNELQVGLRSS